MVSALCSFSGLLGAFTLRRIVLAFSIIIVSFRSQNILDLLQTKPSGKLWPTPPHRCHASIRTLNGPLKGPVQVGVRSKYPGPSLRDEPGIVGAAIYRAILIDQHSLRSHPNKAVDVVVCQTSWIDSGSRFINSGSALRNQSLGIVAACFPPGRLRSRRYRHRLSMVQRLVQPSGRPPLLGASPLRTGLDSFPSSGSSIR